MPLLQNESNDREPLYPIAYGSKTTDTETRYANIEHELLGVVGALEKFHYFTFDREVKILTDHKPLIAISKKSLVNVLQLGLMVMDKPFKLPKPVKLLQLLNH